MTDFYKYKKKNIILGQVRGKLSDETENEQYCNNVYLLQCAKDKF